MRKPVGVALLALAVAAPTAAVSVADPGLPDIPKHRHYVANDAGRSEVGPRVCDNAGVQQAFNQFHSNAHVAVAGSPGPRPPAPGLHNGQGGEIVAGPC